MDYTILFLLLCCIILITIIIILHFKNKKLFKTLESVILKKHELEVARKGELKKYFQEEWNRQEKFLNDEIAHHKKENQLKLDKLESDFKISETELNGILHQLEGLLKEKEKRYNEVNQDLETYKAGKMKEIDSTAAEYEQRKRTEIEQILKQAELNANSNFNNQVDSYLARRSQMQSEIEKIKSELEEERTKRAAINEEILRRRQVEEKQDFYRIQLDPNDKDDVEILRSVAPRLRHPEAINKVIWSAYYQKPLAELRKRVAIEGSGIYKITRIKTGEVYIGKAVNVSDRWTSHVKTALGVGTLASSQLHRVMREDGPEQFVFELLEETPKEKLSERESYYIDFYDSKTYGLNTIRGEQK